MEVLGIMTHENQNVICIKKKSLESADLFSLKL